MLHGLEFFFDVNLKRCRWCQTQWRSYDITVIGTRLYSTVMFSAFTAIATIFLKPVYQCYANYFIQRRLKIDVINYL